MRKKEVVLGEYQLCPKCSGSGKLNPPYPVIGTSIVVGTCDVCFGAKIIARPIMDMTPHSDNKTKALN